MNYQDTLATNLRMLRAKRNTTQEAVSSATGIGQDALSSYEQGKRMPTFSNVLKLADFYGVGTDELVGRKFPD